MKTRTIDESRYAEVERLIGGNPLFSTLPPEVAQRVVRTGSVIDLEAGEMLTREGDPSDCFYLVIRGEVGVSVAVEGQSQDLGRLGPGSLLGEIGLLLDRRRTASLEAMTDLRVLCFEQSAFTGLLEEVPAFTAALCRLLANRLVRAGQEMQLPEHDLSAAPPEAEAQDLLPHDFMVRHRVVPIRTEGDVLVLGVIDAPSSVVKDALGRTLPGLKIRPVRVQSEALEAVLRQRSVAEAVEHSEAGPSLDLVVVLRKMVAEGASDLHLSAGQRPRWRIDGAMTPLPKGSPLGSTEVLDMLDPAMTDEVRKEFETRNDTDFAYAVDGAGRFRVNLFRDLGGVGAVLRHIPQTILSLEQLGMPAVVQRLCKIPAGLVLVTGPTGSGKSTTLAGMIDFINRGRQAHIISLEDPVEFVHISQRSLVNQREVGTHTESFSQALRAALREDPDIVLVGEMRDLETVKLGLETANTGHLVFGTLHTATAVGTVDRIIDMFPAGEQNQIRTMLAESLKGVIAQTLCRRIGGGRVAAVEILIVDRAVSAMIRMGKMQQVPTAMQTGGAKGNQLLNPELARLVREEVIERGEAMRCSADKVDLAKLLPPG